jgi:hypothetical protein
MQSIVFRPYGRVPGGSGSSAWRRAGPSMCKDRTSMCTAQGSNCLAVGKGCKPSHSLAKTRKNRCLYMTGQRRPLCASLSRPNSGLGKVPGAARLLGLQSFATATRMVALACKLCQILRVLTLLATVLLIVSRDAATGGVRAFLRFGHCRFLLETIASYDAPVRVGECGSRSHCLLQIA